MYYNPISSGYIGILPEGPLIILVEVFEALKLVYFKVALPHEHQMNLSYMVLLDMWNMFGQKFLSFIGGKSVGRVQQSHLLIINR